MIHWSDIVISALRMLHYCATEGELGLADGRWCVAVPVEDEGVSSVMMGFIRHLLVKSE